MIKSLLSPLSTSVRRLILTNDEQLVDEYMEQLNELVGNDKKLTHS